MDDRLYGIRLESSARMSCNFLIYKVKSLDLTRVIDYQMCDIKTHEEVIREPMDTAVSYFEVSNLDKVALNFVDQI